MIDPLPHILTEPVIRAALAEDLGLAGDLTTEATVPREAAAHFTLTARQPGVIAGLDLARQAFAMVHGSGMDLPELTFTAHREDGDRVAAGEVLASVSGAARTILTGERVALNLLGHLSGVATATAQIADAISHTAARVCCTRKTTPGLRALEKYAVRAGGGSNHRLGLGDAVLIKDNHIAVAGSLSKAVARACERVGHLVAIEVEVDTLEQLDQLLDCADADRVQAVLLDNMEPPVLRQAVDRVGGRMVTEASGTITAATAPALAETGVDLLSAGWITHSAPVLDIGLDAG